MTPSDNNLTPYLVTFITNWPPIVNKLTAHWNLNLLHVKFYIYFMLTPRWNCIDTMHSCFPAWHLIEIRLTLRINPKVTPKWHLNDIKLTLNLTTNSFFKLTPLWYLIDSTSWLSFYIKFTPLWLIWLSIWPHFYNDATLTKTFASNLFHIDTKLTPLLQLRLNIHLTPNENSS